MNIINIMRSQSSVDNRGLLEKSASDLGELSQKHGLSQVSMDFM